MWPIPTSNVLDNVSQWKQLRSLWGLVARETIAPLEWRWKSLDPAICPKVEMGLLQQSRHHSLLFVGREHSLSKPLANGFDRFEIGTDWQTILLLWLSSIRTVWRIRLQVYQKVVRWADCESFVKRYFSNNLERLDHLLDHVILVHCSSIWDCWSMIHTWEYR